MGKYSGLTDNELINQFKSGEQNALGILFTRYTSLVYGTCMKYLKDRDESKDAVMQIFEKLNQSLHQHEVSNFKSWLYVSARNHCLMQLRSRKGKHASQSLSEGWEPKEITPGIMESAYILHLENEPELEQNLTKLEKCIEELGHEQKQCVRLFYLQEKCYKDVADETGFDLGKVKSFIQNGKRNLKLCMEKGIRD
jgi:RNA polymerase sigma-70 factor (ECF subfamily)